MHKTRILILCFLFIFNLATYAHAENAVLAAGAGYKKMVNALNEAYEKSSGERLDLLYGNMGRVTTLAKKSGNVDIVLGDKIFLEKAALPTAIIQPLGKGKLVLAFAKGSAFEKVADLDNKEAGRIALPDTTKAIYGKAARQFLENSGRLPEIQTRLVEVATVPQVFSYLTTNEVDMGFINLTHALNVKEKLGGFVVVDDSLYSEIIIQAALLSNGQHQNEAQKFLLFLQTPEAMEIIRSNGL